MFQSWKKLHAAHAVRADIFSELRTFWFRNHADMSRLPTCVVIFINCEVNIVEGGLKTLFEGRNEAQKIDLRLTMRSNEI
jgi:hypothetical protein